MPHSEFLMLFIYVIDLHKEATLMRKRIVKIGGSTQRIVKIGGSTQRIV
jgi:hypothetical protein